MVVLLFTASAIAHHSFSAEFDVSKPVKVSGKVTSVRWSNPHAWIYIDVETDGKVVNWAFETATANALYRRGWRKEDLSPVAFQALAYVYQRLKDRGHEFDVDWMSSVNGVVSVSINVKNLREFQQRRQKAD